jgi:hypothetical protein
MLAQMAPEAIAFGFGLGFFLLFGGITLLGLALTAFWIWMLVDCAQAPEKPGSNDRVVWILVLVFTSWLGALIYYFAARQPRLAARRRPAGPLPLT